MPSVNVLMKILLAVAILALAVVAGYGAGYKKGGEDFAYLDHIMMGFLANANVNRCEASDSPRDCYRWDQDLSVGHAFSFYTQNKDGLSPIAKYVFPESYQGYLKSVAGLHDLTSSKSAEDLCAYISDLGKEELAECISNIATFEQAARRHINKKLQPTADAPAE